MSEKQEKLKKLVDIFERKTGKHGIWGGKYTKQFKHWLSQKIKYKNLKCNICGREFDSKYGLNSHIWNHDDEKCKRINEKISQGHKNLWQDWLFKETQAKAIKNGWKKRKKRLEKGIQMEGV